MQNSEQAIIDGVTKCAQQFDRFVGDELMAEWVKVFGKEAAPDLEAAFSAVLQAEKFPSFAEVKRIVSARVAERRAAAEAPQLEKQREERRRAADEARARQEKKTEIAGTFGERLCAVLEATHSRQIIDKGEVERFGLATRYAEMMQELDMDFGRKPGNFEERRQNRIQYYAQCEAKSREGKNEHKAKTPQADKK